MFYSERGKGREKLENSIKRLRIILFHNERAINTNSIGGGGERISKTQILDFCFYWLISYMMISVGISESNQRLYMAYIKQYIHVVIKDIVISVNPN